MINTKSRHLSCKTGEAYPVRIHNYKRRWNRLEGPNQPWMGIIPIHNSTVNGVLFQVNETMIKAFDERELKWGYSRKQLSITNIQLLTNKIQLNDKIDIIFTYELSILHEQENNKLPMECEEYKNLRANPQCYTDVCLKGCMQFGEQFLIEFIESTHDWRYKWNLDRYDGVSRRAWDLDKTECQCHDKMLSQCIIKYHSMQPLHLQKH